MASNKQSNMNPQGQPPRDVGEDLPDPPRKPSESDKGKDKDRGKEDAGKKATAYHKPGKM